MMYAYARVSAKDQNLQRQIAAFREFGIEKSRIFSEKKSGKTSSRRMTYSNLLPTFCKATPPIRTTKKN